MKHKIFSSPALFWGLTLSALSIIGAISNVFAAIHTVEIVDDGTGEYMSINADGTSLNSEAKVVLTKSADKSVIDIGEQVVYTVHIFIDDLGVPPPDPNPLVGVSNTDVVFPILHLVDTLPDANILELQSIDAGNGITCQNDAAEIRCQMSNVMIYNEFEFTSTFIAKNPGTANNSVVIRDKDNVIQAEEESNVLVQDPGNVFIISSDPDKNTIERGEDVTITTTITNRTNAETITDINFLNTYASDFLQISETTADTGVLCSDDSQKVQCHIESLAPGETKNIITTYTATDIGQAVNKMSIESAQTQAMHFDTNVLITEPSIQSLLLKSTCEGRNLFIGNRCSLVVIAQYEFAPEQDVSVLADFTGYQSIATVAENLLTITNTGEADIAASYNGKTSNTIHLVATDGVKTGEDFDGNLVSHFAVRPAGGEEVVNAYNSPITVGSILAESNIVAYNDKITFSDIGVVSVYDWFLEDASFGTLRDANTNGECTTLEEGIICRGKKSVSFEAKNKKGSVLLRLMDDDGNARNITIHVVDPAVKKVEITSVNGKTPENTISLSQQQNISLTTKSYFVDGTEKENTQDEVEWEFRWNGSEWTDSSENGKISRGVFTPLTPGTFIIRAKAVQNEAMPGVNFLTQQTSEALSQEIALEIGDPVAYIESMHLQGNQGVAKGTGDVLFVRLRHEGGIHEIGDMELNIIKGSFSPDEKIPENAQRFSITLVPEKIYATSEEKTLLLQIPFFVPEIDDITDGMHTLQLIIHGKSGLEEDVIEGRLNTFVGEPQSGDGDLDGEITLKDAVIAMRILEGNVEPSGLQVLGYDVDRDKTITLRDILEIFQSFLSEFLG